MAGELLLGFCPARIEERSEVALESVATDGHTSNMR